MLVFGLYWQSIRLLLASRRRRWSHKSVGEENHVLALVAVTLFTASWQTWVWLAESGPTKNVARF